MLRKGTRQGSDGSGDGDGDGAPCPVQGGGWGPLNGLGSWHAPGRQRVPNKDQTQAPAAQLGLHPERCWWSRAPPVPPWVLGQGTSPPCLGFPVCRAGRRVPLRPGGDNALSLAPSGLCGAIGASSAGTAEPGWGDSAGAAPVPEGTWRSGQPPGKASDIPQPAPGRSCPLLYKEMRLPGSAAGPGEPRRARCMNDPDR